MGEPLRVLHCPAVVGGNPAGLARAERELGLRSRSVALEPDGYGYPVDELLCPRRHPLLRELRRWSLLRRALLDFDVVHFNFGMSIMPQAVGGDGTLTPSRRLFRAYARVMEQRDLGWLRRAGKGIVVTYQGDDARQGDFCRANFEINHAVEGYFSLEGDELKRRRIARVGEMADRIYSLNPDLLHVLPESASFMPYASVDPREWSYRGPVGRSAALVVAHAPTHRAVKGTSYVVEAVRALGGRVSLRLLEGLSRSQVPDAIAECDIFVDQVLTGWYGAAAVEAMALGKPVVAYIREPDLRFIPDEMRRDLPVVSATPSTLPRVLAGLTDDPRERLTELGRSSRAFVERWHDPLKIAARLKDDYEAICAGS